MNTSLIHSGEKNNFMQTSLELKSLCSYVSNQLNNFFPDQNKVDLISNIEVVKESLQRLDNCFKNVNLKHYFNGSETIFNHLFSDHYVMFLWFLSNTIFHKMGKCSLADKVYYLNKTLNGLDCMYDTNMPDIFLVFHSSGTMLGKATYSNYFIALHGCTVGSHNGKYPVFGEGVAITANSSVIGNCRIGDMVTISTRTTVFEKDINPNETIFFDYKTGKLISRFSENCYSKLFFNF